MKLRDFREARSQPLLPVTPENITIAKKFVMKKWIEREREDHDQDEKRRAIMKKRGGERYNYNPQEFCEPTDLTNSCKYSSYFCSIVFGGKMMGNMEHYFTKLPNGEILDLNDEAKDVRDMLERHKQSGFERDSPYYHDEVFCHKGVKYDQRDVSRRVSEWLNEFCREQGLPYHFERTRHGTIRRG